MRTLPSRPGTEASPEGVGRRHRRLAAGVVLGVVVAAGTAASSPLDPMAAERWAHRVVIRARGGTFVTFPGAVLQSGRTDCGPAALATLLRTLGGDPPPSDSLAALSGTGAHGTTFGGLRRAARALGLETELVRVDPAATAALTTPVIAWVDEGHFVTVVPGPRGSAIVLDPLAGPYRIRVDALRRFWKGEALLPRPPRMPAGAEGTTLSGGEGR